jgi:hypothetical protein
VSVPPGPHLLSDIILTSPILYDPERPTAEGGAEGMEDGIDPNMDPELAMVSERSQGIDAAPLRVSLFITHNTACFTFVMRISPWHARSGSR